MLQLDKKITLFFDDDEPYEEESDSELILHGEMEMAVDAAVG
jgi:hypothetical protein